MGIITGHALLRLFGALLALFLIVFTLYAEPWILGPISTLAYGAGFICTVVATFACLLRGQNSWIRHIDAIKHDEAANLAASYTGAYQHASAFADGRAGFPGENILNRTDYPSVNEVLRHRWRLPMPITIELEQIIESIGADFIDDWFLNIVSEKPFDRAFPDYVRYVISNALGAICYGAVRTKPLLYVFEDVSEALRFHLHWYRHMRARAHRKHPDKFSPDDDAAEVKAFMSTSEMDESKTQYNRRRTQSSRSGIFEQATTESTYAQFAGTLPKGRSVSKTEVSITDASHVPSTGTENVSSHMSASRNESASLTSTNGVLESAMSGNKISKSTVPGSQNQNENDYQTLDPRTADIRARQIVQQQLIMAEYASTDVLHPACNARDASTLGYTADVETREFSTNLEMKYMRSLASQLSTHLLPRNEIDSPAINMLVSEVVASCVLTPLIRALNSEFLNEVLMTQFASMTGAGKSSLGGLMSPMDSSFDNQEELGSTVNVNEINSSGVSNTSLRSTSKSVGSINSANVDIPPNFSDQRETSQASFKSSGWGTDTISAKASGNRQIGASQGINREQRTIVSGNDMLGPRSYPIFSTSDHLNHNTFAQRKSKLGMYTITHNPRGATSPHTPPFYGYAYTLRARYRHLDQFVHTFQDDTIIYMAHYAALCRIRVSSPSARIPRRILLACVGSVSKSDLQKLFIDASTSASTKNIQYDHNLQSFSQKLQHRLPWVFQYPSNMSDSMHDKATCTNTQLENLQHFHQYSLPSLRSMRLSQNSGFRGANRRRAASMPCQWRKKSSVISSNHYSSRNRPTASSSNYANANAYKRTPHIKTISTCQSETNSKSPVHHSNTSFNLHNPELHNDQKSNSDLNTTFTSCQDSNEKYAESARDPMQEPGQRSSETYSIHRACTPSNISLSNTRLMTLQDIYRQHQSKHRGSSPYTRLPSSDACLALGVRLADFEEFNSLDMAPLKPSNVSLAKAQHFVATVKKLEQSTGFRKLMQSNRQSMPILRASSIQAARNPSQSSGGLLQSKTSAVQMSKPSDVLLVHAAQLLQTLKDRSTPRELIHRRILFPRLPTLTAEILAATARLEKSASFDPKPIIRYEVRVTAMFTCPIEHENTTSQENATDQIKPTYNCLSIENRRVQWRRRIRYSEFLQVHHAFKSQATSTNNNSFIRKYLRPFGGGEAKASKPDGLQAYPNISKLFPPKRANILGLNSDRQFTEQRRQALQSWLHAILADPVLCCSHELVSLLLPASNVLMFLPGQVVTSFNCELSTSSNSSTSLTSNIPLEKTIEGSFSSDSDILGQHENSGHTLSVQDHTDRHKRTTHTSKASHKGEANRKRKVTHKAKPRHKLNTSIRVDSEGSKSYDMSDSGNNERTISVASAGTPSSSELDNSSSKLDSMDTSISDINPMKLNGTKTAPSFTQKETDLHFPKLSKSSKDNALQHDELPKEYSSSDRLSHEHNTLGSSSWSLSPIEMRRAEVLAFSLVSEAFELSSQSWLRRNIVSMSRTMIKLLITHKASKTIGSKHPSEQFALGLRWLRELLWTDGIFSLATPSPPVAPELKWYHRETMLRCMLGNVPGPLAGLVGRSTAELGLYKIHSFLQCPMLVKSLICTILDLLLLRIFPDLDVGGASRKFHSMYDGSTRHGKVYSSDANNNTIQANSVYRDRNHRKPTQNARQALSNFLGGISLPSIRFPRRRRGPSGLHEMLSHLPGAKPCMPDTLEEVSEGMDEDHHQNSFHETINHDDSRQQYANTLDSTMSSTTRFTYDENRSAANDLNEHLDWSYDQNRQRRPTISVQSPPDRYLPSPSERARRRRELAALSASQASEDTQTNENTRMRITDWFTSRLPRFSSKNSFKTEIH